MVKNTSAFQFKIGLRRRFAERFIVYFAGDSLGLFSFQNFTTAERSARFLAAFSNRRTEVFDSVKDICYFIEPSAISAIRLPSRDSILAILEGKNKSGKQESVMNETAER